MSFMSADNSAELHRSEGSPPDKIFIDTNMFVYTADDDNKYKQAKAKSIIADIKAHQVPVISTQVLQEFYNACTTKLHLDKIFVKSMVRNLNEIEVVLVTFELIEQGIDISILSQISFWDGLIIAAAEFANCTTLLSEDLNDGQVIRGVKIVNPLIVSTAHSAYR
ncbi:twitching motility protein PilT [Spirochaetia bacterium]|nr:twitching motility protein PilT [Spirochaetia bacterium]